MNDTTTPTMEPLAVGAREASRLLGISERKLWERSICGDIPSFKIGTRRLYRPGDLRTWLAAQIEKGGR